MHKIIVAGIGTHVGKTVVSAILMTLLKADYWKPIQSGDEGHSDTNRIKQWMGEKYIIHRPAYQLKAPLSPHHAARLENISINLDSVAVPQATRSLIIEGIGGILVPLTHTTHTLELFHSWNCKWVIVSKHYLGSINHTLLTYEALKQRHVSILGILFNGTPNPDSESVILNYTQLPCLGRLYPEKKLNLSVIQRYALEWTPHFSPLIN